MKLTQAKDLLLPGAYMAYDDEGRSGNDFDVYVKDDGVVLKDKYGEHLLVSQSELVDDSWIRTSMERLVARARQK